VRIFLDTNVLASSIATRGLCSEVLESVLHDHELLTCGPLLAELERVLVTKLRLPKTLATDFLSLLRAEGQFVQAQTPPSVRIKDPDDIPILACAIAGGADVFVTGDKALLALEEIDGLPIVSPRELWIRLAGL
jgi:uncharacterized protein